MTSQDNQPLSDDHEQHKHHRLGLLARLRAYFFAGVLVAAPISITFYLAWLFVDFVDTRVSPLIPDRYEQFRVPGIGLVLVVIFLTLVGAMTAGWLGRVWLRGSEKVMSSMPVIRTIYMALKQIFETVLAQKSTAFREVALIEYPRRGIWCLAFITGETVGEVQNLTDETVVNVFLPTTPNPTSGFLLFLPKREVFVLDMTVEEGIKMVMSGGIITPPDRRPKEVREQTLITATPGE